ncbi:hypothetical protein SAMN03080615_01672 [Amphritea atlantica]|uniref:Uncharacterized protein n=1 Tax=Amphritea atlantica TaxID=355243 RepID=A0A1H9GGU7_9GAMM|nr:hypothetical protein [Amphritea atlantica]SEQ49286.1 hypothetical protein SAMN03080615_01672 [Amphritea atlantica]
MVDDALVLLREKLLVASDAGEIITIVYHGGSNPGESRKVAPIKVAITEMRARCYETDAVKVFKLNKIAVPDWGIESVVQVERLPQVDDAYVQLIVDRILAKKYHVDLSSGISVHEFFKNGKPRKSAVAVLAVDDEGYYSRPFSVRGPGVLEERRFKDIRKAFQLFEEQVSYLPDLSV